VLVLARVSTPVPMSILMSILMSIPI